MLLADEGACRRERRRKTVWLPLEARIAYDAGALDEHARIKVRCNGVLVRRRQDASFCRKFFRR